MGSLDCRHPENIINGRLQDSYGCLKAISQAKISLNVMPWFKEGAHDRVFNSMLNGAVCFTDWSLYFEENMKVGGSLYLRTGQTGGIAGEDKAAAWRPGKMGAYTADCL